jgi:hypothetical protein
MVNFVTSKNTGRAGRIFAELLKIAWKRPKTGQKPLFLGEVQ